jgi:hypothetical protein
MKKRFYVFTALFCAMLVLGLGFAGCKGDSGGPYDGIWTGTTASGDSVTLTINGNSWSSTYISGSSSGTVTGTFTLDPNVLYDSTGTAIGTFSVSGNTMTAVMTGMGSNNGTYPLTKQ